MHALQSHFSKNFNFFEKCLICPVHSYKKVYNSVLTSNLKLNCKRLDWHCQKQLVLFAFVDLNGNQQNQRYNNNYISSAMRNIAPSPIKNSHIDSNYSKLLPIPQQNQECHLQIIQKLSPFSQDNFQNIEQFTTQTNDTAKANPHKKSAESPTSPPSKRPNFHNFQKHSVVLIKKLTKKLPRLLGDGAAEIIAKRMWSIFLTSGIYNKKIIVILFGNADLSSQAYRKTLMSCYFGELCHEPEGLLREAQQILRRQVLAILETTRIAKNIQRNRHIKSKSQFLAYFNELVQQLREGPLHKFRLSSKATHQILQTINSMTSLEEGIGRVSKGKLSGRNQ